VKQALQRLGTARIGHVVERRGTIEADAGAWVGQAYQKHVDHLRISRVVDKPTAPAEDVAQGHAREVSRQSRDVPLACQGGQGLAKLLNVKLAITHGSSSWLRLYCARQAGGDLDHRSAWCGVVGTPRLGEYDQPLTAVKLLLTGFEPFGMLAENPSATIVHELSRRAAARPDDYPGLRVAILPAEFAKAERAICELLETDVPDVLLALGVAARAQGLRLERTARNQDDAALPDNAGELRKLTPIVPGGPDTFESTLPIQAMQAALEQLGVPVAISDDAGGYVCNHVFYTARQVIASRGLPTRCGFLHVPLCTEQVDPDTQQINPDGPRLAIGTLPRAKLVEAIECCIQVIHSMGAEVTSPSLRGVG
jgi:pyroglutamyl-peptidase